MLQIFAGVLAALWVRDLFRGERRQESFGQRGFALPYTMATSNPNVQTYRSAPQPEQRSEDSLPVGDSG